LLGGRRSSLVLSPASIVALLVLFRLHATAAPNIAPAGFAPTIRPPICCCPSPNFSFAAPTSC
jgi:hypothetical protein